MDHAQMRGVEGPIGTGRLRITQEAPDSADARACLDAYFAEIGARFDGGFELGPGGVATDLDMAPPAGCFLVARLDGKPIGCGGLKTIAPGVGEIKRMWVDGAARGMGVAKHLLEALEAGAPSLGLTTLRLDTNRALNEAQAFYRKAGYAEIARYNDNPYADFFFEKKLAPAD